MRVGETTTQLMTCNHFINSSGFIFHLYLKFIQLTSKKLSPLTRQFLLKAHIVKHQMSPHCHLTVNDWNLLLIVSGAENCY